MTATRPEQRAILVVEDDADTGTLIAECLEGEGYRVVVASDVPKALAALNQHRFALVLTDALVPWGQWETRWAAIEQVRQHAGTVPVIICTARPPDDFADYAGRGFAGLLAKPFDLDRLLTVVAETLAR